MLENMIKLAIEEVVFDASLIQSITCTNNSLMLFEDGYITILSPTNWTYHEI